MIRRVYEQCSKSNANKIIIATDDDRIKNEGESFGAEVVLTSKNHRSGTDRIFEVAKQLNMNDDEIIINVQGDEPLIPPTIINQVANNISTSKNIEIATLCAPIQDEADFINPNIVKRFGFINEVSFFSKRNSYPRISPKNSKSWLGIFSCHYLILIRVVDKDKNVSINKDFSMTKKLMAYVFHSL